MSSRIFLARSAVVRLVRALATSRNRDRSARPQSSLLFAPLTSAHRFCSFSRPSAPSSSSIAPLSATGQPLSRSFSTSDEKTATPNFGEGKRGSTTNLRARASLGRDAGGGARQLAMTTTRLFRLEDLFRFNNINLDALTET